jgi:ribosome maturation factor RimP
MLKDDIQNLIQSSAQECGYMVYESFVYLKGANSKITVRIDSMNGISHGDCDRFSAVFSDQMDEAELLENYMLEVSSPGLRRRLETPAEFRRFIGKQVKIIQKVDDGTSVVQGVLEDVSDTGVVVNAGSSRLPIAFDAIEKANLDY